MAATLQEMQAELDRLQAENSALKSTRGAGHTLKVSAQGGVSLYGLGKWPVTLYDSQWTAIITLVKSGALESFMLAHAAELKRKPMPN